MANPIKETAIHIIGEMMGQFGGGAFESTSRHDNSTIWQLVSRRMAAQRGGSFLSVQEFADALRYLESIGAIKTIIMTDIGRVDGTTELLWYGRFLYHEMRAADEVTANSAIYVLPAPNIIHINRSVSNSQLQQGTSESHQVIELDQAGLENKPGSG